MEKITKKEFLARFNEADESGIILNNDRRNNLEILNRKNIGEITNGDFYRKDGFEHVVVNVNDDYVEINNNPIRAK